MLRSIVISIFLMQCLSCQNKDTQPVEQHTNAAAVTTDSTSGDLFFPVTTYLRGQINDIRNNGVNPMMYITIHNRTDSSWLKAEDLEKEMAPFLENVIDTANMKSFFSEKKFLDQTLNAYTFSYDPKTVLPDSIGLRHWDVYVDPNTNKVRRIYLIVENKKNKQQLLTWQSDKSCKIVTIGLDKSSNSIVEKEVFINWDF